MKFEISAVPAYCLGFLLVAVNVAAADFSDLVNSCEDCHGKDGISLKATVPSIGGFSVQTTLDSFAAYQDKTRPCEEMAFLPSRELRGLPAGEKSDMCKVAAEVSEDEIQQIAEHFAGKPFVAAEQDFDAGLASEGEQVHARHCEKCHEDGGSSVDDDAGYLAGQWMPYLQQQFADYASGKRAMSEKMKVKMDKLSDADIQAVLNYYGSLQ